MADEWEAGFESGVVPASTAETPGSDALPVGDFATGGDDGEGGFEPATPRQPQGQRQSEAQVPGQVPGEQPTQEMTIRSYLASRGVRSDHFQDDYAALDYLVRQDNEARRLQAAQQQIDAYAQIGRQLQPHAAQLQQFLGQQQQPAGPKPWTPPPFEEKWAALVQQDPASGVYIGKPGTPPEIVDAANKYATWTRDFLRNPAAMMEAYATDREGTLEQRISERFEQRFQQRELEAQTRNIVAQNSAWFYQRDASGAVMRDPYSQQPVASPIGRQYVQVVEYVGQMGVKDPVARDNLAKMILRNELAAAQVPPNPAPPANSNQQRALVAGRPNRSPLQALSAQARRETRNAPEPEAQMSLDKMLHKAFAENGVTAADFEWGSN